MAEVRKMAEIKALISLSFGGALGLMFLMLGCVYDTYWPLLLLVFYALSPVPYCVSLRAAGDAADVPSNACAELAVFFTTGIVIAAFGLPTVFARAGLISWGSFVLLLTGNVIVFLTTLGFFYVFGSEEEDFVLS